MINDEYLIVSPVTAMLTLRFAGTTMNGTWAALSSNSMVTTLLSESSFSETTLSWDSSYLWPASMAAINSLACKYLEWTFKSTVTLPRPSSARRSPVIETLAATSDLPLFTPTLSILTSLLLKLPWRPDRRVLSGNEGVEAKPRSTLTKPLISHSLKYLARDSSKRRLISWLRKALSSCSYIAASRL